MWLSNSFSDVCWNSETQFCPFCERHALCVLAPRQQKERERPSGRIPRCTAEVKSHQHWTAASREQRPVSVESEALCDGSSSCSSLDSTSCRPHILKKFRHIILDQWFPQQQRAVLVCWWTRQKWKSQNIFRKCRAKPRHSLRVWCHKGLWCLWWVASSTPPHCAKCTLFKNCCLLLPRLSPQWKIKIWRCKRT